MKATTKYKLFMLNGQWYIMAPYDLVSGCRPFVGRALNLQEAIEILQFDSKWRAVR